MISSTSTNAITYWPEAYAAIMQGEAPEDERKFYKIAKILVKHALLGNGLEEVRFSQKEYRRTEIEAFRTAYVVAKKNGDFLPLLNQAFMQALTKASHCELDEDDINFIVAISIPSAFTSIKKSDLLNHPEQRAWLENYRKVCTKPQTIVHNVKAYRGLSKEQIKQVNDARIAISGPWYELYKKKEVTKEQIVTLEKLLADSSQHELLLRKEKKELPVSLQEAAAGYLKLKDQFPKANQEAYMASVSSNLQTFIKMATDINKT